MDSNPQRGSLTRCVAVLLGTASLAAMGGAMPSYAQGEADEIPETVLITGSLIRGTTAVGVPVSSFRPQDFATTGALTAGDLFRFFPAAIVSPGPAAIQSAANVERGLKVNIRGLDTGSGTRSLLMIDGMRFPAQANGLDHVDPSIIPALSMERIDILVNGASATYGSDAISGVINIILKRNMDGAITQARWTTAEGGKNRYAASALWGRTWDGGQITLSYEWYNESETKGNAYSQLGQDHTPWGFDDRRPLGSSAPATLSVNTPRALGGGNVGTSAQLGHGCTNCYAVPLGTGQNWSPGSSGIGPTAPFSASTLDWSSFNTAGNSGTNGVRNQFEPYDIGWYDAAQERNGGHITVDQRLTSTISFYGSGFYSNRRARFLNPANFGPSANNVLFNVAVPTFNPYYPTGGAPTNLRVSYNLGVESPPMTSAYELAQRYQLGLNIVLPGDWNGRVWYAMTNDQNFNNTRGGVNKAAVSAALGWTIAATPATGTTPAIATWTKPSNVPYLNLFCDASAYTCNSDATIAYFEAIRYGHARFWINEKGTTFDGPLFDLPGGTVKAAVGATYTSFRAQVTLLNNGNASSLIVPYVSEALGRQVWAAFTQINAPIFSERNALPLLRRLELEFSWRHDQYSDFGGTSNPKVAFNWSPIEDFTIRGTWGTSFRAPSFSETSFLNERITGQNLGQLASVNNEAKTGCTVGFDLPPVGSGAWKVQSSAGNGMPGSATACVASLLLPPGISVSGANAVAAIRTDGSSTLGPEQATNWGIGFDYVPTGNFLSGLNIQATYYVIKLTGGINAFSDFFNDPRVGDLAVRVPTDWADSGLPGAAGCTNNLLPTTCAPFQEALATVLANPRSTVDPQARTSILFIHDFGGFNAASTKLDGIDWSVSYDWDWGDLGAWNAGMLGTYYLHQKAQAVYGAPIADLFHTTVSPGAVNQSEGVGSRPRLGYRARLGWSDGPWSVTGFVDYVGRFYHEQAAPPNVNGNFCASNGGLDAAGNGGTYTCAIQGYTNVLPAYATFDLSLGYDTMDAPSNEYLRNIGVQLVVQNVLDKHGQYQYRLTPAGGNPCTCDIQKSLQGRTISLIVTKQW